MKNFYNNHCSDSFIFKGQIQIFKQHFDVEMVSSQMFGDCKSEIVTGNKINMRREISILHDIRSLIKILSSYIKKTKLYSWRLS